MLIIIINITILFIFILSTLLCTYRSQDFLKTINKKEHKLYFIYPLADWILKKTPLEVLLYRKNNAADAMKALYTTSKPELLQRLFWYSKLSLVIAIIVSFDVLSLFSQLAGSSDSVVLNGKYLQRPEYGKGSTQVDLNVTMEETGKENNSDQAAASKSQDITVEVEERVYTAEELEVIFEKAFNYLETTVLGDNKASDQIYSNLYFINKIPGTGVTTDWEPENDILIQFDGTVNNQSITEEGITTSVLVTLTCQKQRAERRMSFRIMPKQYSKEEILFEKLVKEITNASQETAEDRLFKLPDKLEHYQLSWSDTKDNNSTTLLFLGILAAIAAWFITDRELDKKMKKRREQMLLDYPELINKFTLLVNAGMTIKQAWNKITEDYSAKSVIKKDKKRYAYEEMLTTANELKLGIAENIAYEQYGRRIGLIPYIKFSSLIVQNLKKGTKGFTDLMMKEAAEAFENRKEAAKRLGEEAGTKLLIPMMLMLIMVFLIIMIPAFLAFRM